ncbi:MAG: tetraacyldisaccharide 4'-kinase [Burkholderiales bacterium]
MEQWLQRQWYQRASPPLWLLPFSLLFALIVRLRCWVAGLGWFPTHRLPVPVLVVGNITVGGTGKTPLTLALVEGLQRRGWHPGIVSRGFGGTACGVREVHPGDSPVEAGDEPVLMAGRSRVPVWIAQDRVSAGRALLRAHPEVNVLISDDGLQHLALVRDMEIAVVDGQRLLGNGALLPAGPLREPRARLDAVDAVVVNGPLRHDFPTGSPQFGMTLQGRAWVSLNHGSHQVPLDYFRGQTCRAVAGIGNPERFFEYLKALGITVIPHAFPDHHAYVPEELRFDSPAPLLMTEKDGIKCRRFDLPTAWMLPVDAILDPGLEALVDDTLQRRRYGWTIA